MRIGIKACACDLQEQPLWGGLFSWVRFLTWHRKILDFLDPGGSCTFCTDTPGLLLLDHVRIHFHKQKSFRSPDTLKLTLSTKGYRYQYTTGQPGTIYHPISPEYSQEQKFFKVFLNPNRSQFQSWFWAVQVLCKGKSRSKPSKCVFVNRKLNLHQKHTFNKLYPFFIRYKSGRSILSTSKLQICFWKFLENAY